MKVLGLDPSLTNYGWVVIDKPGGMTSARVVSRVRGILDAAKAGHAGTLDPMATGLLSDYLRPEFGNLSIRCALVTMVMVNIWCATHYYLATRTLREDLARAPA